MKIHKTKLVIYSLLAMIAISGCSKEEEIPSVNNNNNNNNNNNSSGSVSITASDGQSWTNTGVLAYDTGWGSIYFNAENNPISGASVDATYIGLGTFLEGEVDMGVTYFPNFNGAIQYRVSSSTDIPAGHITFSEHDETLNTISGNFDMMVHNTFDNTDSLNIQGSFDDLEIKPSLTFSGNSTMYKGGVEFITDYNMTQSDFNENVYIHMVNDINEIARIRFSRFSLAPGIYNLNDMEVPGYGDIAFLYSEGEESESNWGHATVGTFTITEHIQGAFGSTEGSTSGFYEVYIPGFTEIFTGDFSVTYP